MDKSSIETKQGDMVVGSALIWDEDGLNCMLLSRSAEQTRWCVVDASLGGH